MERVFTHDAVIHSDSSEVILLYPSGLIDMSKFRICAACVIRQLQ